MSINSTAIKTFCRNCTSMCGLEMQLSEDGNSITSVRGDRQQVMTNGYHCIKALSSVDFLNDTENRLQHSVKRTTNGDFEKISAEIAMDEIADKIQDLVEQYGPRSVGIFYGTGSYFNGLGWPVMKSFLCELGSPNLFSTMTIDQSARWVSILRMGMMASGQPMINDADTVMIIGKNPVISHQLIGVFRPGKALAEFKKRGGNLIVVDPRATETTRHASHHLAVKPGEDASLLAGLIHIILNNKWHDAEFCERFANDLPELRAAVSSYTSAVVSEVTGVSEQQLFSVAQTLSTAKKGLVVVGTGICMTSNSNLAVHLSDVLNVLCGNYLREGDVVKSSSALLPREYIETVVPPNRSWEVEPKCNSVDVGQLFGEFPTGALPDEILSDSDDRIRALIVLGGNPVTALGQPKKTVKAFKSLELLVSIDPRMTETSKLADYVIAPPLQYERHDLSTVVDGIGGYTQPFVQYTQPVVAPPNDTLEEAHFFWGLAKRLNLQLVYKKMILGMDYKTIEQGWLMDMTVAPDNETLAQWWCEETDIDFEQLKQSESGLLVDKRAVRVKSIPDTGARLALCPADVSEELKQLLPKKDSDEFPYRLISRRLLETMNSLFRDDKRTRDRYPVNYLYMCSADMQENRLEKEGRVSLTSPHGTIQAMVREDKTLQKGVVSMAHQWGDPIEEFNPDAGIGSFTGRLVSLEHGDVERINRMPRQSAIPVKLQAIN